MITPDRGIPYTQGYRVMVGREAMLTVVGRVRPDVIEVGNPYLPAWVAMESGRRWHIPAVGFYHSDDPRALLEYHSAADLFINPGPHKTFGLVSVEAQACGTRVSGVRGGGMDKPWKVNRR